MTVSKWAVLSRLPAYRDQWQVVTGNQDVGDIIKEIVYCQRKFGKYYDRFSDLFLRDTVAEIADALHEFCELEIEYREETVKVQSSAIPTGILLRGRGDCKHYALFIAGVLASLNRLYGLGIKWWFYFAGYEPGDQEPYHVFVAVWDPVAKEEIWIDPTPGAAYKTPTLLIKKSV